MSQSQDMSQPRPVTELVHPTWAPVLEPLTQHIADIGDWLRSETAAGRPYLPAGRNVLRAFTQPFDKVKILIVGQDPYPTPGHAVGLSFSVERNVRPIPRSLQNIYRELSDDLGIPPAEHGDLTAWSKQGVLLLNRVLTVQRGVAGSHRGRGWETVTEHAIRALAARPQPLVAILWGRDARNTKAFLGSTPTIESAHPSPLSARSGFFGSRPFSRANAALEALGVSPVDWQL